LYTENSNLQLERKTTMCKNKKTRFTYHTSTGNHPQPPQATWYLSSCYSAARGHIHVANSFHTATQPFPSNNDLSTSEVTPSWLEDQNVLDSDLPQEQPEELDPKYKAYQGNQVDSDNDEDKDESNKESVKRKRTAGVHQVLTKLFSPTEHLVQDNPLKVWTAKRK
jgi:hypothetical protein